MHKKLSIIFNEFSVAFQRKLQPIRCYPLLFMLNCKNELYSLGRTILIHAMDNIAQRLRYIFLIGYYKLHRLTCQLESFPHGGTIVL